MRTIVHIVVAFAMLFGSFASFNTPAAYSAASPQPELTGTPTETPPPTEEPVPTETVLPTQDPAPTATLPLAETPPPAATPTPTVPPPPAELPTPTPTPEAVPWIEFSTRPAVMPKNGKVTFSWHILQAQDLNASLRITLPPEVTPQNLEGLLFDAATNQVTLAAQDGSLALQAVGEIGVEEILFKAELIQADQVMAQSSYTLRVAAAYLVSRDGATLRGLDGRVTLEVPAGALAEDALFTISVPTESFASEQAAVAGMIEIIATGANSDAEITQFDQPVTIGISYDDLELGSRENGLTIQYFDEELQDWRRMPTYLDTENNIAYTRSNHLTIFGMDVPNWQAARLPTLDSAQTALFTGAGTYSMSFWMPPGPGGLQPSLALSYNSQVVDQATAITQASYVGMGWSLDTGSIERDFHGTMDYLPDDTFSINTNGVSDRLLPGTDGYYHTASESFWRIQLDTANDIWYAWDKTGTKYTFGGTQDSKVRYYSFYSTDANCIEKRVTWRYSLSQVENNSGKHLDYAYQKITKAVNALCDTSGTRQSEVASYPLTITYPNNRYRVSFVWAEGRKDFWGNWTGVDVQVFYQKKSLDKLQVLQDTNGDGVYETVIRAYDFTYLDDSSLENIFPNMLWNPGASEGRTLTLYSVQEKGLGESQTLPATTFEYDGMHLTKVNNGYNGAVKFEYERIELPFEVSESAKWLEDINYIEIVGKALPTAAACSYNGNWRNWSEMSVTEGGEAWCCNGNGICFRHTATVPRAYRFKVLSSGYVNARREWVRPGGVYFLSATVEKVGTTEPVTNAQIALFDTWPVEGDYTTPALNADGVITKTFEWEKTRSHNLYGMVRCEHCKLTNFDLYLLPSFYRVTAKNLYTPANAGTPAQTYSYTYEGAAMNTTANSALLNCDGDCYYDPYTEFRGHSQVTETVAPDGRKTVTHFGQTDTDKGKVLQVDVLTGAGALLNRTLYTYEFNAPIAADASLLPHSGSNVYNELTITWPRVTQVETHINEGNAESDYAGTRTTYEYDPTLQYGTQYGNLTRQVEYEKVDNSWVAYRTSQMRYYPNSGAVYVVGLPAYHNQYACPAGNCDYGAEDVLSSVVYFYDSNTDYKVSPTTGKLAYQRTAIRWGTQYTVAKYQDTGYLYDAWGNLTTTRAYKDEKTLGDLPGTGTNYQETVTCYGTGNPNPSQLTCTDDGYNTYPFWVKNSLGHITSFTYDKSKGVPLTETDPNNVPTSAEYDGFGRMLKLIRQGDSSSSPTVQISYHDTAEKFYTEASQKLDATTHFVMRKFYDGLGRPIQTQVVGAEVNGNSSQTIVSNTTYSVISGTGQQVSQTVPFTVNGDCGGYCNLTTTDETTTQYDALGRVLWVKEPQDTNPNSYAVQNSYTVNTGNCLYTAPGDTSPNRPCATTSSTDRSGTTTQSLSSARGLTGRVHPTAGPDVNYFYDAAGHLTTARYGTASTSLTYDLAGRKTSMTDPDMGYWRYYYDALGNLTSQTDARTCTTSLTYDGLNRLTGKSYTGTCSTTSAVSYSYDAGTNGKGRRTGMTDASGGTTWTYDTRGRVFTELWDITGPGSFKTQWTYNSADQVKTIRYPAGNDGALAETVTYNYLPQMTLDTAVGTNTYVSDIRYDAEGRMTQMTRGSNVIRTSYGYFDWTEEANGGRLEILESLRINATPNTLLQSLTYAYDDNGNILSIVDPLAGGTQTQTFGYDVLNRLTSAQAVGGNQGPYALESYTYNAQTGNLASKAATTYEYQDTAHVHAVTHLNGVQKYWYDANGNQTKRITSNGTYDLTYDGENRLVSVIKDSSTVASFVYNGDGARVQSTINGVVTAFVGNRLEWSGSATTMKKYYYAGSQRVAMRTGASTLNFLLGDHLGSTSLTTSSAGAYQSETLYKPWGEVRYSSGTLPTKYTFTGQYSNVADFGLMYYGARWYDPSIMQFSSPDTLIPDLYNPLDWNRYLYARANPIRYNDPSGHVVACDRDDWACQTHWDYPIYLDNAEYTFDTGLTERQVEFLMNAMEIGLPIVFEPIDWMMTYDACILQDDCSPLILLGLLPVIPSSLGNKADDIIGLLPKPKRANWPWHHLLPQQFRDQFLALGVKIDDFQVSLPKGLHEKIHEGAMGGAWNKAWGTWLEANPGATPLDIYKQISVMIHDFGLDGFITIIPKRK